MTEVLSRSNAPTRRKPAQDAPNHTDVQEKDEAELRLEKVLFGDDAGFLDSLTAQDIGNEKSLVRQDDSDDDMSIDGEDAQNENLDKVPDEDLFFLDAGTGELPAAVRKDFEEQEEQEDIQRRQPVWHDSDEDRITVSLASNTRLRKLRDTADDDVISGREYIARLRRQYERLHPTPEWVTYARKKRRTSSGVNGSGSDSDSDISMSNSESTRSVQPLAALLRNAGSLTRSAPKSSNGKRRKFRTEVIDISKLPPITASGPSAITSLEFHPTHPLLLTSGSSSTASLYHVSPHPPNPSPLLTSLHLKGTPLHTTSFCILPNQSTTTSNPSTPTSTAPEHDKTQIILSSRRRHFHTWSLSTGTITRVSRPLQNIKHTQKTTESFKVSPLGTYVGLVSSSRKGGGSINILDTTTLAFITSCRIDSQGGIADFHFWGGIKPTPSTNKDNNDEARAEEGLAVIGKSGEVSEYSISARRIIARWIDDGAVGSTVLTISRDGRWIAIGSSSGIVNIYDRHSTEFKAILTPPASASTTAPTSTSSVGGPEPILAIARPKPTRTLSNLTTPISHLVFSNDSQMLVMASRWKRSALRLIHLPSCTVYKNWPTDKTSLGRVSSVALSPDGGILAVGNETGAVRLWEIRE